MKRLCVLALMAAAVCLPGLDTARAGANEVRARRSSALGEVRKIYVGDMGRDDEAERFRLLLEEQLSRRGFTVVGRPEEADAVLTGALSVRVYDEKSEARVFVRLESQSGARLWSRDFGHKRFKVNPLSLKEPTRRRAEEVAQALHRDWEKATK
ncbi:MAG: hypothetical protein M3416_12460 [Acidobacteriota bacterium]|nr:hypothetical protein [Acidobacteriota bacterium]